MLYREKIRLLALVAVNFAPALRGSHAGTVYQLELNRGIVELQHNVS